MIIRVKSRGRNITGRSRGRDRSSKFKRRKQRTGKRQVMPYGKHKGKRFADIPRHYLVWMNAESTKHRLKNLAAAELRRRWKGEIDEQQI